MSSEIYIYWVKWWSHLFLKLQMRYQVETCTSSAIFHFSLKLNQKFIFNQKLLVHDVIKLLYSMKNKQTGKYFFVCKIYTLLILLSGISLMQVITSQIAWLLRIFLGWRSECISPLSCLSYPRVNCAESQ